MQEKLDLMEKNRNDIKSELRDTKEKFVATDQQKLLLKDQLSEAK